MSIQEQVPSLELCQQLKEAGFPQTTIFAHTKYGVLPDDGIGGLRGFTKICSAPLASEIGEQLKKSKVELAFEYLLGLWVIYIEGENWQTRITAKSHNEATARAEMYLYLKSNKLI